jgi:hypothetical protein
MAEWSVTGTERDVLLATKLYLPGQPVRGGQVAWLSLDAGDNDPARFWRHVVAALDRARPATGSPRCSGRPRRVQPHRGRRPGP